jgi:hypothetical protein
MNTRFFWISALILGSLSAIAFGIAGIGRPFSDGQFDMSFLYVAGRCLRQGLSPYAPESFMVCSHGIPWLSDDPYAYPPQMGFLSITLSYLQLPWARVLITTVNLACIIGLAALCGSASKSETDIGVPDPAPEARWLIPALIVGNPFTAHILWMGQTTLIATSCLAAGWVGLRRGYVWLAGLLLGFGTIKPQIAAFVVFWLLLERRWKALTIAAAWILLLSSAEIAASGPIGAVTGWISAVSRYTQMWFNLLGNIHVFGVQNLLAGFGFDVPALFPVGLAAVVALWWFRRFIADRDILPLLIALSLLFVFSHDYDLSALAVMLPAFWRHLRGKEVPGLVGGVVLVLLFLPVRILHDSLFAQYRVLIVLGLVMWLLVLNVRFARQQVASDPFTQPIASRHFPLGRG